MQAQRTGVNPVKVSPDRVLPQTLLRLQRMARELRLTDQILSLDVDSLSIVEGGSAPAWTSADGANITIDAGRMPGLNNRIDIAVWLGTNAHELFHNLFTPRASSLLMRRVQAAENSTDPGIHRTWNVLEDQRIERLGLARYEPWRGYLIAALAHHIPVSHPEAWTLVAGRTWLSDETRAIARAAFVATNDETSAVRCAQLIGAYQRLSDPGEDDASEAWVILNEFHGLFGHNIPPRGGCGGSTGSVEDGEPEPGDSESSPYPTADEADAEDDESDEDGSDEDDGDADSDEVGDDEADDDGDDDGESDDDDGDDGDGDADEASDGDGESDEGDDGDDGDESDEGESDGNGGSDGDGDDSSDGDGDDDGIGERGDGDPGDGTGIPDGKRSITESIGEDIADALDDEEASADLDRVVDTLAHGATAGGNLPRTTGVWEDATEKARLLARDVTAVLAEIKDDCEASWVRRTDTGRFSVDRWATEDWDPDNVFDLFDPGAMDASSLDLVLVLDISGSMSEQNKRLAEATWAIRHAVDRVEGQVTCIGFGDDASLLFPIGQRPDGRIFLPHLEGSTDPTNALREAHRLVADSQATNRIVLVLTDGQWWGMDKATAAMLAAGAAGAITCVVGLGEGRKIVRPGFGGAQVTAQITDSSELVPIFRQLAETSMLAAAGR